MTKTKYLWNDDQAGSVTLISSVVEVKRQRLPCRFPPAKNPLLGLKYRQAYYRERVSGSNTRIVQAEESMRGNLALEVTCTKITCSADRKLPKAADS